MKDSSTLLETLRGLPTETEWLEFKEAKNSFSVDDLGRYWGAYQSCVMGAGHQSLPIHVKFPQWIFKKHWHINNLHWDWRCRSHLFVPIHPPILPNP